VALTKDQVIDLLKEEVKGLTSYLVDIDYSNAVDNVSRETGWSSPFSGNFQELWIKNRAKRHLFFYLLSESAHKFKIKQINLQHRFEHYYDLIYGKGGLDAEWEKAKEDHPEEFLDDFLPDGVGVENYFGTKVDAGFQYEPQTGKDTTYTTDNEVCFSPSEDD